MADTRWNPGAVAKDTVPRRKRDVGRERNEALPGRGGGPVTPGDDVGNDDGVDELPL